MFKGMKPLPKALIILVIIAAPIGAYIKFAPAPAPKAPVVEAVVPTPVPAEDPAVTRAAELAKQPIAPVAAEPAPEPARSSVTSGDRGMDALLKAGKK